MTHDPEVETVEIKIKYLELRADDESGLLVSATLATCPRCRMTGCAIDQSRSSVDEAIKAMRNCCPCDAEPRVYVIAPGTELPYEGDPFAKEDDDDTTEPDRDR